MKLYAMHGAGSIIAEIILEENFCDPKAVKCYLMNPSFSFLPAKEIFIHCELFILKRDNLDQINKKVQKIAKTISKYFPKSFEVDQEALSFEVRHMLPENYHKGKLSSF